MIHTIQELLAEEHIRLSAPIPLTQCRILRPYLLERVGIRTGTAVMLAVPYAVPCEERNVSAYAVGRDYHLFFRALFERILPRLQALFPAHRFAGFSDHSPIDEVQAAARAGLGVIGDHGLLLTQRYSSYIFLGEILTDAVLPAEIGEVGTCRHCGACHRACPVGLRKEECLSALTQKKGALSEQERARLAAHPLLWGCDTCQEACPYTKMAKANGTLYEAPPFFRQATLPVLTQAQLDAMDETAFAERAYAWRTRAVIQRNLALRDTAPEEETDT